MTAIIHQLQSQGIQLPSPYGPETQNWNFKHQLEDQEALFYINILHKQALLSFEYDVCCAELEEGSLNPENFDKSLQRLIIVLMIAEMLEHLYTCYLNAPSEIGRLRRDQKIFRMLLTQQGYQFDAFYIQDDTHLAFFIKKIRDITTQFNFSRVLMTRIRQLLSTLDRLITSLKTYHDVVLFINAYISPILSHLVWIFFTPRLLVNLGLLLKHTIPGWWMTEQEKALGLQNRIAMQWDLRWFELTNDAVWVFVGLGNCFVLVNTLTPYGPYLTLVRHVFDVILTSLKAYFEINRLNHLKQTYENMLQNPTVSLETRNEIINYLIQLNKRLTYESTRYYARAISAFALFLAITLTMPIFASTPMITLIGAVSAVFITLFSSWLEPKKPADVVMQLNTHGLFRAMSRDERLLPNAVRDEYVIDLTANEMCNGTII